MARILIKIGVKTRNDRDAIGDGSLKNRQSERRLGRDVDQIGLESPDRPANPLIGRAREPDLGVERDAKRGDPIAGLRQRGRPVIRVD
jgi:hypothetical protein